MEKNNVSQTSFPRNGWGVRVGVHDFSGSRKQHKANNSTGLGSKTVEKHTVFEVAALMFPRGRLADLSSGGLSLSLSLSLCLSVCLLVCPPAVAERVGSDFWAAAFRCVRASIGMLQGKCNNIAIRLYEFAISF